ncbi:hypothetical protein ACFQ0O_07980 [Saccharopolyspora spinosporotrichia]
MTTLLNGTGSDHTVLVSTIDGLAGVGKSTLVVQWAHQVRERFPDGELYVNLRGFDPAAEPMTPGEALGGFITALGVAPEAVPSRKTPEPRSSAHCCTAGGCSSCWTTPATPSRCCRCCLLRPGAWSW